ncbi:hypothetical protein MMC13_001809 [Lambiella insularis]|nr:hypothetical protein [Lambiella insularis]
MASGQGNSAPALGPSNELSGRLQDYDLIEFLDMSGPAPKRSLNPFCEPAPELNGSEVDAGKKPIILDNDRSKDGDTQDAGRDAGGNSNVNASDSSVSGEQDVDQRSLSTPLTSVASSEEAGLHEKNEHSTSSTPSSPRQILLLLAQGKQACESSDGGPNDIEFDPLGEKEKENQRDDKEGEADEEEEPDGDSVKHNTPLPCPTKKRCLSAAEKKSSSKRLIKRRRFSSPLSSDEETETRDESDTTSYIPRKPHHILTRGPTPSHPTGLDGGISNHNALDVASGELDRRLVSRTAVIYEQQSWEREIIHERDVKQRRGRPRKEYLVEWKRSWMPTGRLTAPGLLESWKAKKASKCKR